MCVYVSAYWVGSHGTQMSIEHKAMYTSQQTLAIQLSTPGMDLLAPARRATPSTLAPDIAGRGSMMDLLAPQAEPATHATLPRRLAKRRYPPPPQLPQRERLAPFDAPLQLSSQLLLPGAAAATPAGPMFPANHSRLSSQISWSIAQRKRSRIPPQKGWSGTLWRSSRAPLSLTL
jgi:hypothetical protein